MALFDGVVPISDDRVPVILAVEDDGIRLSANGTEIGQWEQGAYEVTRSDEDAFIITADGDAVSFVPHRPGEFARAVGLSSPSVAAQEEPKTPGAGVQAGGGVNVRSAPAPKPMTRALFYTLAGTTGVLAVWALIKLVL
jgi:hypothetical protein